MSSAAQMKAQPTPTPRDPRRLRLTRIFLWSMIASLATCAAIAIVVLLLSTFNRTTGRILGTLGALAFHSGVAMVLAHSLDRRWWPGLSRVGFVLFAASLGVLVTAIWWPSLGDDPAVRGLLSTVALTVTYVLAVPSASLVERRHRAAIGVAGLGSGALALLMTLVIIWSRADSGAEFVRATAVVLVVAFACAHTSLLLHVPLRRGRTWLRNWTHAAAWLTAIELAGLILWEIDDDLAFRVLGALAVLTTCGTLTVLILARLQQVENVARLTTTAATVELRCPRCTVLQTVNAGKSRCHACGLKFNIEIEEPRCPQCDYLLWQLPERRCPECGREF